MWKFLPFLQCFLLRIPQIREKLIVFFPPHLTLDLSNRRLRGKKKKRRRQNVKWFTHKFRWKVLPPTFTHNNFKISFVGLHFMWGCGNFTGGKRQERLLMSEPRSSLFQDKKKSVLLKKIKSNLVVNLS